MLNARCIALLLLLRGHAAHINGFVAHEQVWEQDGSGRDNEDLPPFDDPSQTCDGSSDQLINITLTDTTECYRFQTPGFNDGGYPRATNPPQGRRDYYCEYVLLFGENNVTGTVTVFQEGFGFERRPDGCVDLFAFGLVDEAIDSEDVSTTPGMVFYCGTLSEDKQRTFDSNFLSFAIRADRSINFNGADVRVCFD
ncbi:uncharacterized protein LOC131891879 [Tigriopus californicus]|uniref:uncharacterized protein LOC131891879 n=1 Tax=Tigriopus californicus TaxID=6832 RepID=UPI0027D9F6F7|nr:uncharacterized protein LOC131891879 [Tigriopus californicus]